MVNYSTDPLWADVTPLPQDDGGPNPLAAISYTEGYAEAMSYLRAIMAANEMSERALELTEAIIGLNPAHYTVWLYRAQILSYLNTGLDQEIAWLNNIALANHKNYQIWHHRQGLLDKLSSPDGEIAFINRMLRADAKNYHVWSYRQWLVRRFGLWTTTQANGRASIYPSDEDDYAPPPGVQPETTELEETALFLADDVRNNSAWNHRFFLVNGNAAAPGVKDAAVLARELDFAQAAVRRAPQNPSPWNYLRGLVTRAHGKEGIAVLAEFCAEFVVMPSGVHPESVMSSHALQLLAEIWTIKGGREEDAARALDMLAVKYDPIRANYWAYLKERLVVAA